MKKIFFASLFLLPIVFVSGCDSNPYYDERSRQDVHVYHHNESSPSVGSHFGSGYTLTPTPRRSLFGSGGYSRPYTRRTPFSLGSERTRLLPSFPSRTSPSTSSSDSYKGVESVPYQKSDSYKGVELSPSSRSTSSSSATSSKPSFTSRVKSYFSRKK